MSPAAQLLVRMLTIRKIRVASGDWADATRTARYILERADAPGAFAGHELTMAGADLSAARPQPSAVWVGSARMLDMLGVQRDAEVVSEQLALALQGRHVISGDRLRREGWIHRYRGRPARVAPVARRAPPERVLGTKTVDLTFSAPKSVSVIWSQARPDLRAQIERAMILGAEAMLECMTQTKPVVARSRALEPAIGFASAVSLHVTARTAIGEQVPAPQLHVHGVVLGVERVDGLFAAPELSGMFKHGAPLEGGAVARLLLAEAMVDLGFEIESETGRGERFFEVKEVPQGLIRRMSARARDVEAGIEAREAAKGKRLTNRERAIVALETRAPKRDDAPADLAVALWDRTAADFGFDREKVDLLRTGDGFASDLARRRTSAREAALRRLRRSGPTVSVGAARALPLESAAGRLRLAEALALVAEMQRAGELMAHRQP